MRLTSASRVCVSIGMRSAEHLLRCASLQAARGERFFEFCLEFLRNPEDGPAAVREFLRRWRDAFVGVSCRVHDRGGSGCNRERQRAIIEAAITSGARMFDIEAQCAREVRPWMHQMGMRCVRVVSYHDYEAVPRDLPRILRLLQSVPADISKVVISGATTSQMLKLLELSAKSKRPAILLAMGAAGLPTRVLTPVIGGSFTYACPELDAGTADGQIPAEMLRDCFNVETLARDTRHFAGFAPLPDALPPAAEYNRVLRNSGTEAVYLPWPALRSLPSFARLRSVKPCGGMSFSAELFGSAWRLADHISPSATAARMSDTLSKTKTGWHMSWVLGETVTAVIADRVGGRVAVAIQPGSCIQKPLSRLLEGHGHVVCTERDRPDVIVTTKHMADRQSFDCRGAYVIELPRQHSEVSLGWNRGGALCDLLINNQVAKWLGA